MHSSCGTGGCCFCCVPANLAPPSASPRCCCSGGVLLQRHLAPHEGAAAAVPAATAVGGCRRWRQQPGGGVVPQGQQRGLRSGAGCQQGPNPLRDRHRARWRFHSRGGRGAAARARGGRARIEERSALARVLTGSVVFLYTFISTPSQNAGCIRWPRNAIPDGPRPLLLPVPPPP